MNTPHETIPRLARRQVVGSAYRTYAVLMLEHERLRRTRWRGELRSAWQPDAAAWSTLRFLAGVHDAAGRSTQVLLEFFEAHPEKEPPRLPWQPWREALRAGIDLAADVLVLHGAELPWGRGKPRVPRNRNEFEAICAFLRDLPADADRPPLSEWFEGALLPSLPHKERAPGHRVTFYRGRQVLSVDGTRIALPAGRELMFLELLAERLGRLQVDRLLTSPMVRAIETARAIAATTGRRAEVWFRCHEHRETPGYVCWGARGLAKHFPDVTLPPDLVLDDWFYGNEPLESAVARADALLAMLAESWDRAPGQRVVVSTHGAYLRTVLGRIVGADPRLMKRLWVHNASLTTLEYTGEEWRLIGFNDTGHLAGHPELDSALGMTR